MKIFLVRHAEGKDVVEKWQSPNTELSDKGRKQAEALGNLPRLRIADKIFSSQWKRTIETAEIATKNLNKQIEILTGIEERHQSSKIYGITRTSNISENYTKDNINNRCNWDWKWDAEEESFNAVSKRALKLRNYLIDNYQNKNVLIFSHETFIRLFVSTCIFGENNHNNGFRQFYRSTAIEPTGVTLIVYREESKIWKLWYLNDYSHLRLIKP